MRKSKLSLLSTFENLAEEIKRKPINSNYWKEEEAIFKKRIASRKEELISITMSSQKFHKSFSL